MAISKTVRKVLVFGLALGAFVTTLPGQSQLCKDNAVNQCVSQCGVVGECIFGCQIGGINRTDTCIQSCGPLGDSCLNGCLKTINQFATCEYVTGAIIVNPGTIVYNRSTGHWQQTVRVTNTSAATMENLGYVLDSLVSGWTLINGDGVTNHLTPSGSPFKNFGSLASYSTTTITLEFNRTGTPAFGYITRVLTSPSR